MPPTTSAGLPNASWAPFHFKFQRFTFEGKPMAWTPGSRGSTFPVRFQHVQVNCQFLDLSCMLCHCCACFIPGWSPIQFMSRTLLSCSFETVPLLTTRQNSRCLANPQSPAQDFSHFADVHLVADSKKLRWETKEIGISAGQQAMWHLEKLLHICRKVWISSCTYTDKYG